MTPAIDDGGFALWESLAITLYLAKKHATGTLYPATLEGEAKAWQWSLWAVQEVDRGVNIWSLHAVRLPPKDRDPQRLAEALKVIECAPDYPTAPDISQKIRTMMVTSPQMRDFINDYMRNVPKN